MTTQLEKATLFKALHVKGNPLILYNIWDAGSAKILQEIGAKAIGTSSWSVAHAHGYEDGEKLPLDLVVANLRRIAGSVSIPITLDCEGGYGQTPTQIEETVSKLVAAGAVGINLEDQMIGTDNLYSCAEQCARIKAAATAAVSASIPMFINARTDIFLKVTLENQDNGLLEEAIHRASAYGEFGADGFFVPGLINESFIEKLCRLSPIPINVMVSTNGPTPKKLKELGVSRISYGPIPYFNISKNIKNEGRKALEINDSL